MANNEILLTAKGFAELEEELNELRTTKREENIQAIKEARSHGDLSENSEYDAARDEQAKIEARIQELEYKLEHATIIENKNSNEVNVGCEVTILYVDDEEVEIEQVSGGFIGFKIAEGNHNIHLTFKAPYARMGRIISLVGIFILIGLII